MSATDGGASSTTEPARGSSTGTDVSLREYAETLHRIAMTAIGDLGRASAQQRVEDQRQVEVALEAVAKASKIHADAHDQQHQAHKEIHDVEKENLDKASNAMDRRLYDMNAIRDQLREQATRFVDRELDTAQNNAMEKRIDQNRDDVAQLRLLIATKVSREDNKTEFTQNRRADSSLRNSTVGTMVAIAALVVSIVVVVANVVLS